MKHCSRGLLVVILVLSMAAVAAGELTDQELRDLGITDAKIRMLRGIDPAPSGPRTAADFLAAGSGSAARLRDAVATGSEQGLDLAREILLREQMGEAIWLDTAVFEGLQAAPSEKGLDVLRDAIVQRFTADDPRWKSSRMAWAMIFKRHHDGASAQRAAEGLVNAASVPDERALYLFALRVVGSQGGVDAYDVYREYLDSPHVELQRAAVMVARGLWDYEAVDTLVHLAFSSSDMTVRHYAYVYASLLLRVGPDRSALHKPRPMRGPYLPSGIYDPSRYAELQERRDEWQRENYRLVNGEEPPAAEDRAPSPWARETSRPQGGEGPVWSRGAPGEGEDPR